MFSRTMMELSTSIPIAKAMPPSDMTLMLMPEKYMSTNANRTENGMENATMSVGFQSLRNSANTTIASKAPISSDWRIDEM